MKHTHPFKVFSDKVRQLSVQKSTTEGFEQMARMAKRSLYRIERMPSQRAHQDLAVSKYTDTLLSLYDGPANDLRDYVIKMLENIVAASRTEGAAVIGYGSLLSPRSRKRTLDAKRVSCLKVKGWTRTFDLPFRGTNTVLNVEPGDWLNAVAIDIDPEGLMRFYAREWSYDFVPVNLDECEFYGEDNNLHRTAYMCYSKLSSPMPPHEKYLRTCMYSCRTADASFGDQFLADFVDTTLCYHDGKKVTLSEHITNTYPEGTAGLAEKDGGY